MKEPFSTKKKVIIAAAVVLAIILFGLLYATEFGRSAINVIGLYAYAIVIAFVGVVVVFAPILIWGWIILATFAVGLCLILWSFKLFRQHELTEEQVHRMEIRHKKYYRLARVLGFVIIGLLVYYFIS